MDPAERKKLEQLALDRMNATADDEEQWSFLFRTEGAVALAYCPWSETEDWEFDGSTEDLNLPWSEERLNLIASGDADPTEEELGQWRRAMCRKILDGVEGSWMAHIVPLWVHEKIAAYALFVDSSSDDPDEPSELKGVFDSLEQAKAALIADGIVADES
jgi:hypothetical protein